MNKKIYVVEDEYTGNYVGFHNRDAAIKDIAKIYLDNGFAGIYDTISIDIDHNMDKEDIMRSLDQIKEDIDTLLTHGYIDSVAYIHEVEMMD